MEEMDTHGRNASIWKYQSLPIPRFEIVKTSAFFSGSSKFEPSKSEVQDLIREWRCWERLWVSPAWWCGGAEDALRFWCHKDVARFRMTSVAENSILLDFLDIYSTPDDFLWEFHCTFSSWDSSINHQPSGISWHQTDSTVDPSECNVRIERKCQQLHIYWISTEKYWISSVNSRRLIRLISEMAEVTAPTSDLFLLALDSHLLAANGTHQCWTSLFGATFFTEIQLQGEASSFKLYLFVSCDNSHGQSCDSKRNTCFSSFKIDHKENEAIGICLPSFFHPIPTLLANFERQLIGANLMGLRPWKSPKVGLRRRCIAILPTFQVILRLEMDKGATLPMQTYL